MKTKLLTTAIACALLISLTGCAADKIASTPTQNVDVTMDTETAIESEGETEAVTLAAETAEKDIPAQPASTEAPQTRETAEPVQPRESEAPKQTESPRQSEPTEAPKQESPSQPAESEQPAETQPEPTKPAEPPEETEQPKPIEPPAPVETEPPAETQPKTAYDYEFDINAIRADCIAIGQSMGYTLNTSLTPQNATWWNPVTASESNQGSSLKSALEQYIRFHTVANLSAYGMDEIAEFNICCESRGGGSYAIFFVFA